MLHRSNVLICTCLFCLGQRNFFPRQCGLLEDATVSANKNVAIQTSKYGTYRKKLKIYFYFSYFAFIYMSEINLQKYTQSTWWLRESAGPAGRGCDTAPVPQDRRTAPRVVCVTVRTRRARALPHIGCTGPPLPHAHRFLNCEYMSRTENGTVHQHMIN